MLHYCIVLAERIQSIYNLYNKNELEIEIEDSIIVFREVGFCRCHYKAYKIAEVRTVRVPDWKSEWLRPRTEIAS